MSIDVKSLYRIDWLGKHARHSVEDPPNKIAISTAKEFVNAIFFTDFEVKTINAMQDGGIGIELESDAFLLKADIYNTGNSVLIWTDRRTGEKDIEELKESDLLNRMKAPPDPTF